MTFTTPPIAPLPYITDAGPPRNSIRSTLHVSNGNVSVPEATKSWAPSYSFITEFRPPKPRDIRAPPPLPGAAWLVMPTIRVSASSTVTSPRCRIVSPVMMVRLAGVSSGVRPRRVAVGAATASGETPVPTTPIVSLRPATSRVTGRSIALLPRRTTWLQGAKPRTFTTTVYCPGATWSKVKVPSSRDRVVREVAASVVSTTSAPITAPPCRSMTRPPSDAVCAAAMTGRSPSNKVNTIEPRTRCIKFSSVPADEWTAGPPVRPET
jgi:hypothetical protein